MNKVPALLYRLQWPWQKGPSVPSPTLGLCCPEPLVTMTSLYRAISYKSHP